MNNLVLPIPFDKLCRICLQECSSDSRSVFSELTSEELVDDLLFVYEIICAVSNIGIAKGDGYSSVICKDCIEDASKAYKFKQKCEKSISFWERCTQIENEDSQESALSIGSIQYDIMIEDNHLQEEKSDVINKNDEPEVPMVVMSEKENNLHCTECNKVYQSKKSFANHPCKNKKKLCSQCGKSITSNYLKQHMLTFHRGCRDFVCPYCSKAYKSKSSLRFHLPSHTGEKPFLCSICGKAFSHPTTFKHHMRFHNNDRRYKCDTCDKTFVLKIDLIEHIRKHTGVKPHVCEVCERKFARRFELRRHILTHTGKKPFMCHLCGKSFARKAHLKVHEMGHTGYKPYVCETCDKRFVQLQSLRFHMQSQHSEVEVETEAELVI